MGCAGRGLTCSLAAAAVASACSWVLYRLASLLSSSCRDKETQCSVGRFPFAPLSATQTRTGYGHDRGDPFYSWREYRLRMARM